MLRSALDVPVDVITEAEAIRSMVIDPGEHVAFLGAGLSKEAGVPLADEICIRIRSELALSERQPDDEWARKRLNWEDPERRYSTCLERYATSAASRVDYFRRLLMGVTPSFAHHALALLMSNDILHPSALTTNFDKLIEKSFVEQNIRECQAIRISEEADFWGPERDKCYLLKLHGDYDTHNILNTREETRSIDDFFDRIVNSLLLNRGLLVLGAAGNEESINKFLGALLSSTDKKLLSRGVRWGVYVGQRKPDDLSDESAADLLVKAVEEGRLNRRILEILRFSNNANRPCQLFPVWSSGGFFLRFIKHLGNPTLEYNAQLLLDHDMRVASLLESRGIPPEAIDKHLAHLKEAQSKLSKRQHAPTDPPRKITDFKLNTSGAAVEIVYCDIASQDLLGSHQGNGRHAVVSADDTLISAGGGVALSLLSKAGKEYLLNELGKLTPIPQGSAVVTSAGNLPLHYIIHAAAMDIDAKGDYSVTTESISRAVSDTLMKAETLGVTSMFIPLIGAGVGGVSAADCLNAIMEAADSSRHLQPDRHITIVIFDEIILGRNAVEQIAQRWESKTN
jgi:O-acetyl-ADP-ribose deacetylase